MFLGARDLGHREVQFSIKLMHNNIFPDPPKVGKGTLEKADVETCVRMCLHVSCMSGQKPIHSGCLLVHFIFHTCPARGR